MPFRVVPKTTTDRVQQIIDTPGLPNSSDIRVLADAYMDLAIRYNRLQIFLRDFFDHTGFETSKSISAMVAALPPLEATP